MRAILHHMLQGLRVDENPLLADSHQETKLDILYEDDYLLIVNKPAGMLSVPGKGDADSVYHRLHILYPDATGPIIVHRLDMATSGLLLAAKTKEAHQNLQAQFKNRTIQKRYIALLEGEVPQDEGEIRLPLCPRSFGQTSANRKRRIRETCLYTLPGIGTDFRKNPYRLLSPNRTYPPATGTRRPSPRSSLPHPWRRALRTKGGTALSAR